MRAAYRRDGGQDVQVPGDLAAARLGGLAWSGSGWCQGQG